MPTYDFVCTKCGSNFEAFQSMKDAPLTTCLRCGKKGGVKRQIGGGAGLIFKGTGFYITDYKSKPAPGGDAAHPPVPTETKPAAAPATPPAPATSPAPAAKT